MKLSEEQYNKLPPELQVYCEMEVGVRVRGNTHPT